MEEPSPLSTPDSAPLPHRFSGRIAQHALLNVLGQAIPLLLGLVTIPIVAARLGVERFGILGLAWAGLALAGAFDLGLGRATVKFVAESIERNDIAHLRQTVSWSIALQMLLGIGAGAILAFLTPLLVSNILQVPASLLGEATATFYLLAASLPFVLLSLGLRAVLEGAERFGLVNLIRIPASSALFVLPAVGAVFGLGLTGIMLLLLMARLATCWVTALAVRKTFSSFPWAWPRDPTLLRRLMSYGGWVAVSNFMNPLLVYFDRFLLGSVVGMAAVAYYAAPYEIVTRLWIIPAGLTSALFPALTILDTRGEANQGQELLVRSLRYLVLLMAVPVVLLVAFADYLLLGWLGQGYAQQATLALQILACGVLVNSLAHLPHAYLQALGRPDLPAKFHLVEAPVYLLAATLLVGRYGVAGAAMAWTFRVTLDAILLFAGAWWSTGFSPQRVVAGIGWRPGVAVVATGFVVITASVALEELLWQLIVDGAATLAFAGFTWRGILDAGERASVASFFELKPFGIRKG